MGFSSEKAQVVEGGGLEFDGKRWVIAGIPLRAPLKPIYTNPVEKESETELECNSSTTTPTAQEARIPARLTCPPPPPRKRKATLKCNFRDFFNPPDLETIFIQRAN